MEFITVFDISTAGFRLWWIAPLVAAILAVGVAGLFLTKMTPGRRLFWGAFNVVMIALFGYMSWTIYSEYKALSAARAAGDFKVVEGPIEDFQDIVDERADEDAGISYVETFTVGGVPFSYSDTAATSSFHDTARSGGPLRPGAYIRVAHVDGKIIKLDVRAKDLPNSAERAAYAAAPVMNGLSEEERRKFEFPATLAGVPITLRLYFNAHLFTGVFYVMRGFTTGIRPGRSRLLEVAMKGILLLWLGGAVAGLTLNMLSATHSAADYRNAIVPIAFFVIAFVIIEAILRFINWAGQRYLPSADTSEAIPA